MSGCKNQAVIRSSNNGRPDICCDSVVSYEQGKDSTKKVRITPLSYCKAFFASMVDPAYDEQFIEKPVHSASGTSSLKKKEKKP